MSQYETIIAETPLESVRLVKLNRPRQLNAYSTRMCEELCIEIDAYDIINIW